MAITAKKEKESSTNDSLSVPYYVQEDDVAEQLSRAEAVAAAMAQGLTDQGSATTTYSLQRISDRICRVTLSYKEAVLPKLTLPPVGEETLDYRFAFQAQPKFVTHAFECIGVYGPAGVLAGYDRKLVNVQKSGGVTTLTGMQVNPLPPLHFLDYTVPNAMADSTYRAIVEALNGKFNDDEFLGHPAGEVQLVSFSASKRTDEDWQYSFGFGAAATQEDVTFDGYDVVAKTPATITVPSIPPTCVVWETPIEYLNTAQNSIEKLARTVHVHRVWELGDFSLLGLPGLS